ncbi:MAG: hypothetical protein ABR599_11645 [Gemmatimonadota bacterium]
MAVTITEIHRVDERGSRRMAEVYPPEDRVTPVCVHLSDPAFGDRLLSLDILVRPAAPFLDAPAGHRPDPATVHRGTPQRNYFTTAGLRETIDMLIEGLPREGVPRYELRERIQPTRY